MATPEVIEYVKQQQKAGVPDEETIKKLLAVGWSKEDVKEIFNTISPPRPIDPHETAPTPPFVGTRRATETSPSPASPLSEQGHYEPAAKQDTPSASSDHKTGSKLAGAVVALVGLVLLGTSGVAAYVYFFFESEDEIFANMVISLKDIKAAQYEIDTRLSAQNPSGAYSFTSSASGAFDNLDETLPSSTLSFLVENTEDSQIFFDVHTVIFDDTLYFKISHIPQVVALFIDPAPFLNQWFSLDVNTVQSNLESASGVENPKLTEEETAQIEQALVTYPPFTLTRGEDTLVGEDAVYVLHYTLNTENALPLLRELSAVKETIFEEAEMKEFGKKLEESVQKFSGDMFIDKEHYSPRRFTFDMEITGDNPSEALAVSLTFTMKDLNVPQTIVPPAEATDFEDFLSSQEEDILEFFGPFPGSAEPSTRDSSFPALD